MIFYAKSITFLLKKNDTFSIKSVTFQEKFDFFTLHIIVIPCIYIERNNKEPNIGFFYGAQLMM